MQFQMRFREAIAEGRLDLTFRRWRARQAVAWHTYRTAAGRLEVRRWTSSTWPRHPGRGPACRHPDAASLPADPRGDPASAVLVAPAGRRPT